MEILLGLVPPSCPSAKINFSYSILFNLTTSYSSYFGGKKGISRNKTSFYLLMSALTPTEKLRQLIASPSPLPLRKVRKPLPPPLAAGTVPSVPSAALGDGPSVFQVLNIFRCCWFLNRDHLIANILSAQKDESDRIFWVDFQPAFHTHLVQQALT